MDVQKLLRNPRFRLEQGGEAEPERLKQFREAAPGNLPRTYLRFIEACNGAQGKIPYGTGHLDLWPVETVLEKNRERAIARDFPGYFAFAGDGADELYLFDLRKEDGAPVCIASAKNPSGEKVEQLTRSFSGFLDRIMMMGVG